MRPIVMLILSLAACVALAMTVRPAPSGEREEEPVAADAPVPASVNPDAARRWRRMQWRNENGEIPPDGLRNAVAQRLDNLERSMLRGVERVAGLAPGAWVERGPSNIGGRTRSLLIDPRDPDRMFAGSVSGGIWKTDNGGATWAPVDDQMPNLAIGCMAMDPADPDVMYAGTGEGFFNGDAIGGLGVFRTTDGGANWTQLLSTQTWENVCRIAVSPADSNVLLASIRFGGVRRSTNGGASWSNVLGAQGSFQVAFDPSNGQNAVAHVIDFDFLLQDWFHRVSYSRDGGATWTTAAGLDRVNGFGSRIELAYAPSDPSIVYASVAEEDGGVVYRSTDGGASFTRRTQIGSTGSSWYMNAIWVDPTNPEFLLTGGYQVRKSTNGGIQLDPISDGYIDTQQPHPDTHFFTHDPGFDGVTNRRVYVCNDGSVYATDNIYTASQFGGWERLDREMRTIQNYGAAGHGPSDTILAGTQDNGSYLINGTNSEASIVFGGDGGFCVVDPANPSYLYGEYISLQVFRSRNGGATAEYIWNTANPIGDANGNANFIAPLVIDPNNPNVLYGGGRSLWRTDSARVLFPAWRAVRPAGSDNISAIAIAPSNSSIVWVGQNNGEVHRTGDAGAATPIWSAVDDNNAANPLPNRYITRIVLDKDDPNTAYVALGGFSPDNLWRTTDGGATWTDISGAGATGIPNSPVRGLAQHPLKNDWLYAGTEVGVFATADGGATWSTTNEGPANVSVDELVFMHHSQTLLAATHGRGVWTIDLRVCEADLSGDGSVGSADLGALLGTWGQTGSPAADLNGDGVVGTADLAEMLGSWGPC